MPDRTVEGQHTLNEIYKLCRLGLFLIGVALVGIVLGFYLRDRADKQQSAARRSNICEAAQALGDGQQALIAANEAFLVATFSPGEDKTPEEAAAINARIEQGRAEYHALVDPTLEVIKPALKNCGTSK
jgi:hypothetical protein